MGFATVAVDAPAHGPFLARWPQSFRPGEDSLDWYVTTGSTTRRVQREHLANRVAWCQVLVEAGTTQFEVEQGPSTSPAPAWSAPTLTGLLVRFTGQDGSVADAVLDGTDPGTTDVIRRDGTWSRSLRRFVRAKVTTVGSGTDPVGTPTLGVRAYLHYRADVADLVELELVVLNACASIAAQGNGIVGMFGHAYLAGAQLIAPAGWTILAERDFPPAGQHLFPSKMATVRRYVLRANAVPAQRATDVLELRGLGRAVAGSSYLTVPSYLAQETLLPDLERGYVYNGTPGYAGARARATDRFNALRAAVLAGTTSPTDYLLTNRLGFFHPLGEKDPQAPGGSDVQTYTGLEQVREFVRYYRLRSDLRLDGCGFWLVNGTTGATLRTRDFGAAYTTPGTIPGFDASPAYVGRQPFPFYVQNNAGYECATKDTSTFIGWWPPAYPAHFLDTRGTLPDGGSNPTFDKFVPSLTPGTPPHSQNVGTCAYENELVTRWIPHPTFAGYFSGLQQGHRDPEDSQHLGRDGVDARACAWLLGDLVAIDFLEQIAEWAALAYSEVGHVPYLYYAPYNTRHLLVKREAVEANPFACAVYAGRGEAWVGEAFATQTQLATPAQRADGYPSAGIQRRAELMYEILWKTTAPNGATYALDFSGAGGSGQLGEAWNGSPIYSGTPIPQRYRIMQIGLELPLVHHATFALGRALGRTDHHPQIMQAVRNHTGLVSAYTHYYANAAEFGPQKYAAVWDTVTNSSVPGATAPRYGGGSGNPGHPNHEVLLEYAFRVSGDPLWLGLSRSLGFQVPASTPLETRAAQLLAGFDWRFSGGLIAYLLGQAGADVPPSGGPTLLSGLVSATVSLDGQPILGDAPPPDDDGPGDDPGDGDAPDEPGGGSDTGGDGATFGLNFTSDGTDPEGDAVHLSWSVAGGEFVIVNGADLARESGLASAVVISLFSDARAPSDPSRPATAQDPRGWWGEVRPDRFGSRLWQLEREKATRETLARAREYARDALAWMIADGIARSLDVDASYVERHVLQLRIVVSRGDSRRWARLWKGATDVRVRVGSVLLLLSAA